MLGLADGLPVVLKCMGKEGFYLMFFYIKRELYISDTTDPLNIAEHFVQPKQLDSV